MLIIGHELADLDCLAAILELLKVGEEKIPGVSMAEIWFWNRNEKELAEKLQGVPREEAVVFVDIHPPKDLNRKNVMVFDHHNTEDELNLVTATQKVIELFGLGGNERIQKLGKWAERTDYGGSIFSISLANWIKKLHLVETEEAVMNWTEMAVESFLTISEENLKFNEEQFRPILRRFKEIVGEFPEDDFINKWCDVNVETFSESIPIQEVIRKFSEDNFFNQWQKAEAKTFSDPISIARLYGFVSGIYGEEVANEWLRRGLRGIQEDQRDFLRGIKEYNDPEITTKIKIGEVFVVIGISENKAYARAARVCGEKELGTIALVAQISERSFQLQANPQLKLDEVVGALRSEILACRGLPAPRDWRELKSPGELPGTEPLYYRRAENDFAGWGSLTASGVESWRTVFQNAEEIRGIVFCAVDQRWLPACCPGHRCLGTECQIFQWRLKRCYEIQQSSRRRAPRQTRQE